MNTCERKKNGEGGGVRMFVIICHVTSTLLKKKKTPRRGIEPRSTTRQAVILATKLSRTVVVFEAELVPHTDERSVYVSPRRY